MANPYVLPDDLGVFDDLYHIIESELREDRRQERFLFASDEPSWDRGTKVNSKGFLRPFLKDLEVSPLCPGINWITDRFQNCYSGLLDECDSKPFSRKDHLSLEFLREAEQVVPNAMGSKHLCSSSIYLSERPTAIDARTLDAIKKILGANEAVLSKEDSSMGNPKDINFFKHNESAIKCQKVEDKTVSSDAESQRLLGIIKMQRQLREMSASELCPRVSSSASPSSESSNESLYMTFNDLDSDASSELVSNLESPVDMKPLVIKDLQLEEDLSLEGLSDFAKPAESHLTGNKIRRKRKSGFPSASKPRLYNFLRELLNDKNFRDCVVWVDRDKGLFKFLDSSRVAHLWGQRKNKQNMKYENFARSLRTYVQKGILTKPRNKLVYCFAEPGKEVIGTADMVSKVKKCL